MPKRTVVSIDVQKAERLIKKKFRHNVAFCEKMQRYGTWVSAWKSGKNLPTPWEAARMCVILDALPEQFIAKQEDVEAVAALLEQSNAKAQGFAAESMEMHRERLHKVIDSLSEEQVHALLTILEK